MFTLVSDQLDMLGYHGPVSLGCDDSKLLDALRLYWDEHDQCHYLVGAAEGKLRVADPEQIEDLLKSSDYHKATKVRCSALASIRLAAGLNSYPTCQIRVYILSLPMPKVTPIIVAAMPILEDMNAERLFEMLQQILDGLIDEGIRIISYASDGTDVERKVAEKLFEIGDRQEYVIPNQIPHLGEEFDTRVKYVRYRGQAICILQDSKHALKTMRNNLFSGARFLVLGNQVATYRRIREMASGSGAPIPERDVNSKLDRQDDNAASRLFSAATLEYLIENHKDEALGEIVYLFVFGELVDAYQNRAMAHIDRIHLALRAHYFLAHWTLFLEVSGYDKNRYHVSRPALDILNVLVNGLIALIIVHRDHIRGRAPLLPWLCSTEPCEHVFGSARQVVKDFTYLDFIFMVPKLRVKIRETVLNSHTGDPKARASGYNHTYVDSSGVDLELLTTFPSDVNILKIAKIAADEAVKLMALLGIDARQLGVLRSVSSRDRRANESDIEENESDSESETLSAGDVEPEAAPSSVSLPSIATWFPYETFEELETYELQLEEGKGGVHLRDLIRTDYEHELSLSHREERDIGGLAYAGVASFAQDCMDV